MRPLPAGRLSKRVVTAWRISAVISTGVLAVMLVAATLAASSIFLGRINAGWLLTALGVSALLLVLNVLVVPAIRYARWRFEVTETEIDIFKGLIVHTRIIVPLVRVQHVDTTQGPVLRALGLASVTVATAAGAHEIPGLSLEEADTLRDRIAALARIAQEDV